MNTVNSHFDQWDLIFFGSIAVDLASYIVNIG